MDVTSAFKSEVFRPVTTIAVPGAVAIAPYVHVAVEHMAGVNAFWKEHDGAFVAIVTVAILAAGLVLENVGALLEAQLLDGLIEYFRPGHGEDWNAYLQLTLRDELVGQRYLRGLVTRLKFELAMVPALVSFGFGLHWVQLLDSLWSQRGFSALIYAVATLTAYLLGEAILSGLTLNRTRKLILEAATERESLRPRNDRETNRPA